MAFHIVEEIRKKSREEWLQSLKDRWTDARIWVQENGELAFFTGFLLACVVVFFFKLVFGVLAIGFLIGFAVYQVAFPEDEMPAAESHDGQSTDQAGVSTNGASGVSRSSAEDSDREEEHSSRS